ncbi:hypothetical protein FRAHR75_110022 [Frankia sp. Hr75.2]|nr:hypothetical protein FRAHR75_110022 [Frankia sp. Hr75.2]SQD98321.1 hypothetical protein FMEAI12_4600034 [Parafrankia sp. Ea1.12]
MTGRRARGRDPDLATEARHRRGDTRLTLTNTQRSRYARPAHLVTNQALVPSCVQS